MERRSLRSAFLEARPSLKTHLSDDVSAKWEILFKNMALSAGMIIFENKRRRRSHFVKVTTDDQALIVHQFFKDKLGLEKPGVLLRIIGSIDLDSDGIGSSLTPQLEGLTTGLAAAAGHTSAWLMSDGLDEGLTHVVGESFARTQHKTQTPLIGVTPWHRVHGREMILGLDKSDELTEDSITKMRKATAAGQTPKRVYRAIKPDPDLAVLEANHTHYLFVEHKLAAGSTSSSSSYLSQQQALMESHRDYVEQHERAAADMEKCPRVLLLVQGTTDHLRAIVLACEARAVVVAAALSGGLAAALYHYASHGEVPNKDADGNDWPKHAAEFEALRVANVQEARRRKKEDHLGSKAAAAAADNETDAEVKWPLFVFYSPRERSEKATASILRAVWRQAPPKERVELAVRWDLPELLHEELARFPAWSDTRVSLVNDVLQYSLEGRHAKYVREALELGADINSVKLLKLYKKLSDGTFCKYPLFHRGVTKDKGSKLTKAALLRHKGVVEPVKRPQEKEKQETGNDGEDGDGESQNRRSSARIDEENAVFSFGSRRQSLFGSGGDAEAAAGEEGAAAPASAPMAALNNMMANTTRAAESLTTNVSRTANAIGAATTNLTQPVSGFFGGIVGLGANTVGGIGQTVGGIGQPVQGLFSGIARFGGISFGEAGGANEALLRRGVVEEEEDEDEELAASSANSSSRWKASILATSLAFTSSLQSVPGYVNGLVQSASSYLSSSARSASPEQDMVKEAIQTCYPDDVWDFLQRAAPWFARMWRHKMTHSFSKEYKKALGRGASNYYDGRDSMEGASPASAGRHTTEMPAPPAGLARINSQFIKDTDAKVRAIDVYIWCVLLGDTDMAMAMLDVSNDPLRAALIGAHLCNVMAERLHIFEEELTEMGEVHERWAVDLLDLCEDQEAARLMLTTPSYHWDHSVIQLAEKTRMKKFAAHRFCQNLCDQLMLGNINKVDGQPCSMRLPRSFVSHPRFGLVLMHALVPIVWRSKQSSENYNGLWLTLKGRLDSIFDDHEGDDDDYGEAVNGGGGSRPTGGPKTRFYHFYAIPTAKQVLRSISFSCYVLLFSFVALRPQIVEDFQIRRAIAALGDQTSASAGGRRSLFDEGAASSRGVEMGAPRHDDDGSARLSFEERVHAEAAAAAASGGGGRGDGAPPFFALDGSEDRDRWMYDKHGRRLKKGGRGGSSSEESSEEVLAIYAASELPFGDLSVGWVGDLSIFEIMLFVWTLSLVLDEWYQWMIKPSTFEINFWNRYDRCYLGIFFIAFLLRATPDEYVPFLGSLSNKVGHEIMALDSLLVWLRLLQYFAFFRDVGILIITIFQMVGDMILWFAVSAIFLAAFSVTFLSSARSPDPFDMGHGPASVAAWAMHGEFEMSKIESWDNTWFGMGPWTLWVYVMISNVLLVNLLIAMMSETYSRVKENALTEWMFDRLGGVLEMVERMHVVPPPFSLPILLHKFCLWAADGLFKKCFKRPLLARSISQVVALDEDDIARGKPAQWATGGYLWELKVKAIEVTRRAMTESIVKREKQKSLEIDERLNKWDGRFGQLSETLHHLREQVDTIQHVQATMMVQQEGGARMHPPTFTPAHRRTSMVGANQSSLFGGTRKQLLTPDQMGAAKPAPHRPSPRFLSRPQQEPAGGASEGADGDAQGQAPPTTYHC